MKLTVTLVVLFSFLFFVKLISAAKKPHQPFKEPSQCEDHFFKNRDELSLWSLFNRKEAACKHVYKATTPMKREILKGTVCQVKGLNNRTIMTLHREYPETHTANTLECNCGIGPNKYSLTVIGMAIEVKNFTIVKTSNSSYYIVSEKEKETGNDYYISDYVEFRKN